MDLLKNDGWFLKNNSTLSTMNSHVLYQMVLNADLKDVGVQFLNECFKNKSKNLQGPIVLQIAKIRNVSAPRANEDSNTAPRLLKLSLTDGFSSTQALEIHTVKGLSLKTAPGTKLKLTGLVPIGGNYLLLSPNNCTILGGYVKELYESWELSQNLPRYTRTLVVSTDGSGPPSWVPFGTEISRGRGPSNFKSLKDINEEKKQENKFEVQRKIALQEIGHDGANKVFGGGKQMVDASVQKIISLGFSEDEAEWALKKNHNNTFRAIKELQKAYGQLEIGRGRNKARSGKKNDASSLLSSTKPSGPAHLSDFFNIAESSNPAQNYERDVKNTAKEKLVGTYNCKRANEAAGEYWPMPGEEMKHIKNTLSYQGNDAEFSDSLFYNGSSSQNIRGSSEREQPAENRSYGRYTRKSYNNRRGSSHYNKYESQLVNDFNSKLFMQDDIYNEFQGSYYSGANGDLFSSNSRGRPEYQRQFNRRKRATRGSYCR